MAQPLPPEPVKLIAGLLAREPAWLDAAVERLAAEYGPVDLTSPDWPFTFTRYYDAQMGPGLLRRFVAFERLVDPADLRPIKRRTNELEAALAVHLAPPARPVNIDPGYVATSKLVLASAKDFAHRIYLGDGIHAEVTLQFRSGAWQKLPWTFPDYADGLYHAFLSAARTRLRQQTARRVDAPGGRGPSEEGPRQ